jgi:ABC-2 type transport system permease protein
MIGSSVGDDAIRYITPFQYFNAQYIIKNSSYETSYMVVGIMFVILAIAASYAIYNKKDVHAV